MNIEDFNKIETIYHAALEIPFSERSEFVKKECGENAEILHEVESLLAFKKTSDALLKNHPEKLIDEMFSEADEADFINKKIGRYKILRKIGEGGMGTVYLAEDTMLDREVTIKFLNKTFSQNESLLDRFKLEAKLASSLNHPNIITIYEIGETDENFYIAAEYIEGKTLRQFEENSPSSTNEKLKISIQIASALDAAHSAGIVHRDIKPDNIMIRPDGFVKILDFGIAKLSEDKRSELKKSSITLTKKGMIIGTANYMSPEQARGQEVDSRTDIFSFGVVMYLLFTGNLPFEGETPSDVIAAILTKKLEFSDELKNIPLPLQEIIKKTLEKEKAKRFQTADELHFRLKDCKKQLENSFESEKSTLINSINEADTQTFNLTTAEEKLEVKTVETEEKFKSNQSFIPRYGFGFGLIILLLTTIGLGFWYFGINNTSQIKSIAVMPLKNESGNKDLEYLADGMTETLIHNLSSITDLSVKSRNSVFRYKEKNASLKQIVDELNVQTVLIGRLVQRNDKLTLNLELIDTRTENILWGENYTSVSNELALLQSRIVESLANKMDLKISNIEEKNLANNYSSNSEAFRAYLRGRYFWNKRDDESLKKSIEYFEQAIELDPSMALAWSGLSDCYTVAEPSFIPRKEAGEKALNAAKKAIEANPNLAEAYASLAHIQLVFDWKFEEAEKNFQKAIELDPNYAPAIQWYAELLGQMGENERGIELAKRALELEPFSTVENYRLGEQYFFAERFDEAREQFQKLYELDSKNTKWKHDIALVLIESGKPLEAIKILNEVIEKDGRQSLYLRANAAAYVASGNKPEAEKILLEMIKLNEKGDAYFYDVAVVHAALDNKDKTFEYLQKSLTDREDDLAFLKAEFYFKNFRSDPRFAEMLKKIGLPV